jgi:hypothetical protein
VVLGRSPSFSCFTFFCGRVGECGLASLFRCACESVRLSLILLHRSPSLFRSRSRLVFSFPSTSPPCPLCEANKQAAVSSPSPTTLSQPPPSSTHQSQRQRLPSHLPHTRTVQAVVTNARLAATTGAYPAAVLVRRCRQYARRARTVLETPWKAAGQWKTSV